MVWFYNALMETYSTGCSDALMKWHVFECSAAVVELWRVTHRTVLCLLASPEPPHIALLYAPVPLLNKTTSTRSASFTANVLLVLHCEPNRRQIIHDFMHLEIPKHYLWSGPPCRITRGIYIYFIRKIYLFIYAYFLFFPHWNVKNKKIIYIHYIAKSIGSPPSNEQVWLL